MPLLACTEITGGRRQISLMITPPGTLAVTSEIHAMFSCLLGCVDIVDVLPQDEYRQKVSQRQYIGIINLESVSGWAIDFAICVYL